MTDLARALEFARETALLGGKTAMSHFGKALERAQKADGTWATEADWAVEAQIRLRIARAFPKHNILGEEEGLSAAGGGTAVDGAPTWIVDPIDGTNNFMAGIPVWATLIALRIDDESVLGVCHAPALGETYDAAIGAGARYNSSEIAVDPVTRLEDATLLHADAGTFATSTFREPFLNLMERASRTRGFGDFWGHMLVARGAAHVMVEPELSIWDVAALQPILSEAGGRLTDLTGAPFRHGGSCLSTNGALHDDVLKLMTPQG